MSCSSCGFDAPAWSQSDLQRTLAHAIRPWFDQIVEGARPDVQAALAGTKDRLEALARMAPDTEAMHEAWRLLGEAGRTRQAIDGVPTSRGVVEQVNISAGGVPKLPVPAALVTPHGLTGDRQANRTHHGRPWQAICLWSADVIDALVAEGTRSATGPPVRTSPVRGIDWRQIRPGLRLQVGSALLETTPYAIPCAKNAHWFSDGDFRRIAHDVRPGSSRIYARVLGMGRVRARDEVVVEPSLVPAPRSPEQPIFPLPH